MQRIIDAENSDLFDVLAHVAYAPLLRLKYHNSIADALADLGRAADIGHAGHLHTHRRLRRG